MGKLSGTLDRPLKFPHPGGPHFFLIPFPQGNQKRLLGRDEPVLSLYPGCAHL
jgi:hypothetical protein